MTPSQQAKTDQRFNMNDTVVIPKYWRKSTSLKTIDIDGLGWFDRVNGNSYHATTVTINKGLKNEFSFNTAFCYGYGEAYKQTALACIEKLNVTNIKLQRCALEENGVVLRSTIKNGAKQRELKALNGTTEYSIKRG